MKYQVVVRQEYYDTKSNSTKTGAYSPIHFLYYGQIETIEEWFTTLEAARMALTIYALQDRKRSEKLFLSSDDANTILVESDIRTTQRYTIQEVPNE